jgi:hypothetical protein
MALLRAHPGRKSGDVEVLPQAKPLTHARQILDGWTSTDAAGLPIFPAIARTTSSSVAWWNTNARAPCRRLS